MQGRITNVYNGPDGMKLYDGLHTKGEADSKWVTYKGYDLYFYGLRLEQFRISPNVLEILSAQNAQPAASNQQRSTADSGIKSCDIFISYTKVCNLGCTLDGTTFSCNYHMQPAHAIHTT